MRCGAGQAAALKIASRQRRAAFDVRLPFSISRPHIGFASLYGRMRSKIGSALREPTVWAGLDDGLKASHCVICADEEFYKDCRAATIVSLRSGLEMASRTIIPKLNSSAQKAGRNVFDAFTVSRP